MSVTIPLDKMTVEEKIQTMETIWDDLCRKADNVISPEWHGNILRDREDGLKNENDEFIEWEKAKKLIRNSIL